MRLYSAQGQRQQASSTYERCRSALESLGLRPSPALEEARLAIAEVAPAPQEQAAALWLRYA